MKNLVLHAMLALQGCIYAHCLSWLVVEMLDESEEIDCVNSQAQMNDLEWHLTCQKHC